MRPWILVSLLSACAPSEAPKPLESKENQGLAPAVEASDPLRPPGAPERTAEERAALAAALAGRGPTYTPRTRHLVDGKARFVNRLVTEHSPYLLQHAHNPVDWWPWGDAAFAEARRLDRPVLLSVGYSTCHWCHVMERESFEDPVIAEFINQHFIAIKVDREERPDIDSLFMHAVIALTGQGGWPMTVVMTPDKAPFFGGTYFPPRAGDRGARQGFMEILQAISKGWQGDRATMLAQAESISKRMAEAATPAAPTDMPGPEVIEATVRWQARQFDARFGGFGRAPKFPRPSLPGLLLRYHRRTGDAAALTMASETLRQMAAGGIRDHLGGGFHRYAVDARWLVPHFEKMLYDGAQLITLYLEAYQATGDAGFAAVAREIIEDLTRDLGSLGGAFASATDAESTLPDGSHAEGWFFTWTPAEVDAALGPELGAVARAWYAVDDRGELDGRNVLHTPRGAEAVARQLGMSEVELALRVDEARVKLLAARQARPKPARDDKIITEWNGLMLSALAQAHLVLGDDDFRLRAEQLAAALLSARRADGRLSRLVPRTPDATAGPTGLLDDHAAVIEGLITLFEATGNPHWLTSAQALQAVVDRDFADPAGGYFLTPTDGEPLAVREKPNDDGALPAGNSVTALNLLRLHALTGDATDRTRAERLFAAFGQPLQGPGMPRMLSALDFYFDTPREVVIAAATRADAEPLMAVLRRTWLPNRLIVLLFSDQPRPTQEQIPLVEAKEPIGGQATAYVCEEGRCEKPTSDPAVFAEQLKKVHPLFKDRVPAPLPGP